MTSPYAKDFTTLITHDDIFYDESKSSLVEILASTGMEVASHSVAHSRQFKFSPAGSGTDTYPEYHPFVRNITTTFDGTITGELRVSKFLLETVSGQIVKSFRPGHLSIPWALPQLLDATEYSFSSSLTANEARTHYPYRSMFDRLWMSETSGFEFPVTLEDELGKPLGLRTDEGIDVANRIAKLGGIVTILIHTDVTGHKLAFEREFILEFHDRSCFSTVGAFGDWWPLRDSVAIEVTEVTPVARELSIQVDGDIDGLTLRIPPTWLLQHDETDVRQIDDFVVLERVSWNATLPFVLDEGTMPA